MDRAPSPPRKRARPAPPSRTRRLACYPAPTPSVSPNPCAPAAAAVLPAPTSEPPAAAPATGTIAAPAAARVAAPVAPAAVPLHPAPSAPFAPAGLAAPTAAPTPVKATAEEFQAAPDPFETAGVGTAASPTAFTAAPAVPVAASVAPGVDSCHPAANQACFPTSPVLRETSPCTAAATTVPSSPVVIDVDAEPEAPAASFAFTAPATPAGTDVEASVQDCAPLPEPLITFVDSIDQLKSAFHALSHCNVFGISLKAYGCVRRTTVRDTLLIDGAFGYHPVLLAVSGVSVKDARPGPRAVNVKVGEREMPTSVVLIDLRNMLPEKPSSRRSERIDFYLKKLLTDPQRILLGGLGVLNDLRALSRVEGDSIPCLMGVVSSLRQVSHVKGDGHCRELPYLLQRLAGFRFSGTFDTADTGKMRHPNFGKRPLSHFLQQFVANEARASILCYLNAGANAFLDKEMMFDLKTERESALDRYQFRQLQHTLGATTVPSTAPCVHSHLKGRSL